LASSLPTFIGTDGRGNVLVTPVGDLDMASGPAFVDAVRRVMSQQPNRLVFDLGSVAFVDSAGCSALVILLREAKSCGVRIDLEGDLTPMMRRVLEVTTLMAALDPA
jgi:anti-anti-sigma factor